MKFARKGHTYQNSHLQSYFMLQNFDIANSNSHHSDKIKIGI